MTGVEIKKVYDAARSICLQTGEMLRTLEAEMNQRKFVQRVQNKRMTTYDLGNPAEWMPYFLEVVFAEREQSAARRGIGVAVLFDDLERQSLEFPIVFAGALDFSNPITKNFSYNLHDLCTLKTREFRSDPPFYRFGFKGKLDDFHEAVGYFLRLETLEDRESLRSLIIEPCIALHKGNVAAAQDAVASSALRAKQFFPNASMES